VLREVPRPPLIRRPAAGRAQHVGYTAPVCAPRRAGGSTCSSSRATPEPTQLSFEALGGRFVSPHVAALIAAGFAEVLRNKEGPDECGGQARWGLNALS